MCAENRDALESITSKGEAIDLYKKTIDWALEEGYPNLATLRRDFADCEAYGIFVDKHFTGEILDQHEVYVFHNCTGTIRTGLNIKRKIIPMLYFANGCNMDIKGIPGSATRSRVPLYVFGDNRVAGEHSDDIECKVYYCDTK